MRWTLASLLACVATIAAIAALAHAQGTARGEGTVAAKFAADPGTWRPEPARPTPVAQDADVERWARSIGWGYAVLFAAGAGLLAVPRLRRGRAAIILATSIAAIAVFLAALAGGAGASVGAIAALNVAIAGVAWSLRPNGATIDLSTSTPAAIAAALAKHGINPRDLPRPPAAIR